MNSKRRFPFAIISIVLTLALILPVACGTLDPEGVYQGDKFVYQAEYAIVANYDGLHAFVTFEKENRTALSKWPEVKKAADYVRQNAKKWNDSAVACLESYKKSPTPESKVALEKALAVLRAALVEANKYLTPQS